MLATHRTPNLTLPMMLPISCKGTEEWPCKEAAPCLLHCPQPGNRQTLSLGHWVT